MPFHKAPRMRRLFVFWRSHNLPMDDIVRQAIAKWPNVPNCWGWLGLDARGNWYMRDDRAQAAGPFPESKGSVLRHEKLIDFIGRNYEADDQGRWFFQNGPQRVYVELENTPLVFRIGPRREVTTHTGRDAKVNGVVIDELGRAYLDTDAGIGIVHTLDMEALADAVESGDWRTRELAAAELPSLYGFVRSPASTREAA